MNKRSNIFVSCIVLGIISVVLLVLSPKLGLIRSAGEVLLTPVRSGGSFFITWFSKPSDNKRIQQLEQENAALQKQLVNQTQLQNENNALRDQFQTTSPQPSTLLPAQVIGALHFIPGVTSLESIIIDKGKKDAIKIGQTVVYKNNVVGKISTISDHMAVVLLVSNTSLSFPAKTSQTNALGILRGKGNGEMILEQVVLSDTLKTTDVVVPFLDATGQNTSFAPNLIVGKIVSVDKKTSNLFQQAQVKSQIDFAKLSMVFVLVN